jgi:hypothetical protein
VIDQLDGKPVAPAVEFLMEDVQPVLRTPNEPKPTVGQRWEFRGVETGGFVGFSEQVWKEVGEQPAQGYGFMTEFCYTAAHKIADE